MKESIVNIEDMTIATELVSLKVDGVGVNIDIVGLLRASDDSENAWVNITPMMKLKGEKMKPSHWLAQQDTKAYIRELFKGSLKHPLEITDDMINSRSVLNNYPKLYGRPVVDVQPGRYGGTWIHKDLFLKFASWISVKFEVASHKLIRDVITGVQKVKIERDHTRELYHPLVEVIDEEYTPKQSYTDYERNRYQLMDLINKKVLGQRAKEFRATNKLPATGDVRDYLNKEALAQIKKLEQDMHGLIHYAKITTYSVLKDKLQCEVVKHPLAS